MNNIEEIYSIYDEKSKLPYYVSMINKILSQKHKEGNKVRIPKKIDRIELIEKYNELPYEGMDVEHTIVQLLEDFFQGSSSWENPLWAYNVGTAPSVNTVALYTATLIENVYLINDDLAGNCCYLEQIVSNLFKNLTRIESLKGIFTFGGTGTNLYGIKLGLDKCSKKIIENGVKENIKLMITEDSHYAHVTCADWLGIGIDNVVKMRSNGLYTDIDAARIQIRNLLMDGNKIAAIIINGGTTYNHAIDGIKAFKIMLEDLVEEFSLDYTPHLHVDSVIGWSWLFFDDYDFDTNELNISKRVLDVIKSQKRKISEIKYADSWGVDFHKGVGGCPIPTSIFFANNELDLNNLSKSMYNGIKMHQIVAELSTSNPSDYTLETSRSAGPALAALSNMLIFGKKGYQYLLNNLIECTLAFREALSKSKHICICNDESLGYCTMVRVYLKSSDKEIEERQLLNSVNDSINIDVIKRTNEATKSFYIWDKMNRMVKKGEFEYSYSSGFKKIDEELSIEALKFYMVSPHISVDIAKKMANIILSQVDVFLKIKSAEKMIFDVKDN